jgi:uncharacterized membrane protein YGL010W
MSEMFRRQLADYVEYHRDPTNCMMHVVGILALFLAAVLPLSLWHVQAFGISISLSVIMTAPVLIYWLLLDTILGVAILGAAILLLSIASIIVEQASPTTMWSLFAALIVSGISAQVVGHRVFEQRKPSMADNPAHFLLGPMFVMAKLFIAFGFRSDLAAIIGPWDQLQSDQHLRP